MRYNDIVDVIVSVVSVIVFNTALKYSGVKCHSVRIVVLHHLRAATYCVLVHLAS